MFTNYNAYTLVIYKYTFIMLAYDDAYNILIYIHTDHVQKL